MAVPVLFLQGGGEGAYEEDRLLADSLASALGSQFHVIYPRIPHEDTVEYTHWKTQISEALSASDGEVIAVGHSLGAYFLVKYLSEEPVEGKVSAIFLAATPYNVDEEEKDALHQGYASKLPHVPIFLYHNRDDEIIPFTDLAKHTGQIRQATVREYDTGGHQFNNDLSAVAADILSLGN